MSKSDSHAFADYILSLPEKAASLREQAARSIAQADQIAALLRHLDRERLGTLKLTGNPNLDAALYLSFAHGFAERDWLTIFPQILEKLERMEKEVAEWEEGGLMLADLTSQNSSPACLSLVVLDVPFRSGLQLAKDPSKIAKKQAHPLF